MDTIFMNLEDSKTSKHHVLILILTDKIDLRRGLLNLSNHDTWKNMKIYI